MKTAPVRQDELFEYEPLTDNQKKAFDSWDDGDNLALVGSAGTGKTFLAMYLALELISDRQEPQEKIVLFRSVVPTREMGFLPGTVEEKKAVFETPYKNIIEEIVIAAGGLCDVPFRLKELEKKFIGRCVNKLQFNEIVPKKFEVSTSFRQ